MCDFALPEMKVASFEFASQNWVIKYWFLTENHDASALVRRREGVSLGSSKSTRTGDENDKENPKLRGPRAATNVASTGFRILSFPVGRLVIWIDTELLTRFDVFILEVSVLLVTEYQCITCFIRNSRRCIAPTHTRNCPLAHEYKKGDLH